MAEADEVLEALQNADPEGTALVTIIGVRGSTYRREGAKLVVPRDGDPVGNISGGCLESEVIDAASGVLDSGEPRTVTYDLTADDEVVWGWGLGCNGVVEVFIEPAATAARFAQAMQWARAEERALALVTVLEGEHAGARLAVDPDGSTDGDLGSGDLDRSAADVARDALAEGRSQQTELADGVRGFIEVLEPPHRLVVCGAGHDAIPVVEFGARLGWKVVVVDDRKPFLTRERFPEAAELVGAEPERAADDVHPDGRTSVVVMSHNFLRDKDYLRSFVPTDVLYIGMLGPSERLERLLDELRREGFEPPPGSMGRVFGPAGLDIGADGPEEIAWAIVSEILAVRRGKGAGFLRDRKGPIHPRADRETA